MPITTSSCKDAQGELTTTGVGLCELRLLEGELRLLDGRLGVSGTIGSEYRSIGFGSFTTSAGAGTGTGTGGAGANAGNGTSSTGLAGEYAMPSWPLPCSGRLASSPRAVASS